MKDVAKAINELTHKEGRHLPYQLPCQCTLSTRTIIDRSNHPINYPISKPVNMHYQLPINTPPHHILSPIFSPHLIITHLINPPHHNPVVDFMNDGVMHVCGFELTKEDVVVKREFSGDTKRYEATVSEDGRRHIHANTLPSNF